MYYEVYLDNLFLVNFLMNLFCLELTNLTFRSRASRRRVIAGAAFGAALYLLPFLVPGPAVPKMIAGFLISAVGMILIAFSVDRPAMILIVAERLFLCTVLMGGCILFFIRLFPGIREKLTSFLGLLGIGTLLYMEISFLAEKSGRGSDLYKVVLVRNHRKVGVKALLDTGNGLTEPVSGKPVCILEKSSFKKLYKEDKPEGFRAIPYHSVGKKEGILSGYLIPEMRVDVDGIVHRCRNVYVGIAEDGLSGRGEFEMILNPMVLKEDGYDNKDCVARKTSF